MEKRYEKENLNFSLRDWKEVFFEKDELTKLPKKVKAVIIKTYTLSCFLTASKRLPALLLATGTTLFANNPTLGITIIILSIMINSLQETIGLAYREAGILKETFLVEYLENIASKMLVLTRNRVEKEDKNGRKEILTTTVIIDIVKRRFQCKFSIIEKIFSNIFSFSIFGFTLVSLIKLLKNQSSDMIFFYFLIVISLSLKIFIFFKESKNKRKNFKKVIEQDEKLSNIVRDLKEVEPMNNKHISFMLDKLLKGQDTFFKLKQKQLRDENKKNVIVSFINSISVILVILKIAFEGGIENLAILNLASVVSLSQLFSNILSSTETTVRSLFRQKDVMAEYKISNEKYKLVYDVYKMYSDDIEMPYNGDTYIVKPFEYTYSNTKFTLRNLVNLVFKRGEFTLLDCASGGGKSTTVKIAIGEIKVRPEKTIKIPVVKYFNDESKLGSGNLFEEITLEMDESKVDLEKLSEIIEGIRLENKFKTIDDLKKTSAVELSNGMYQRILLARTLYNLGDSDMVIIDEPIGSIDKNTAIEVMRFVKEFINKDKKRFGIVCTHQAEFIEDFIDKTYIITSISPHLSEIA